MIPETVYLATDRATELDRLRARAARHGDDFRLSEELVADYFDHFEIPTAEEGPLTVISTPPQRITGDATPRCQSGSAPPS